MQPTIEVNIKNFWYQKYKILENINFCASIGDFIAFFGKSGSGKSTLLKIVGSILKPYGQVFFDGKNIFDFSSTQISFYRNQTIGFDFQENNLIENLSSWENINLSQTISGKKIDEKWLNNLIQILEIEKILNKKILNLSGGEASRVSLAKAIASQPKILICDEPGSNLDEQLTKKVYKFLKDYSKNNIVIVSSHDEKILPYLTQAYELQNYTLKIKN